MRIAVTGGPESSGGSSWPNSGRGAITSSTSTSAGERGPGFVRVDLRDYGQVIDALAGVNDQHDGVDALVHLAAIPAPGILSDVATFHNNIPRPSTCSGRPCASASVASSTHPVRRCWVCRSTPRPRTSRSTRSIRPPRVGLLAGQAPRGADGGRARALASGSVDHGAAVLERHVARGLRGVPVVRRRRALRKWNLWGYIDARDGAQAIERALESLLRASSATSSPRPTP